MPWARAGMIWMLRSCTIKLIHFPCKSDEFLVLLFLLIVSYFSETPVMSNFPRFKKKYLVFQLLSHAFSHLASCLPSSPERFSEVFFFHP